MRPSKDDYELACRIMQQHARSSDAWQLARRVVESFRPCQRKTADKHEHIIRLARLMLSDGKPPMMVYHYLADEFNMHVDSIRNVLKRGDLDSLPPMRNLGSAITPP